MTLCCWHRILATTTWVTSPRTHDISSGPYSPRPWDCLYLLCKTANEPNPGSQPQAAVTCNKESNDMALKFLCTFVNSHLLARLHSAAINTNILSYRRQNCFRDWRWRCRMYCVPEHLPSQQSLKQWNWRKECIYRNHNEKSNRTTPSQFP